MMAGLFALAGAAATNRAAVAEQFPGDNLPPAEDYTRYDKVTQKRGVNPKLKTEVEEPKAGGVDASGAGPALVGAVVIGGLATAGLPALLSPGETAFKAQRANAGKGQGKKFAKGRDQLKKEGKKQWWGR